jgi:hypothetical protein
MQHARRYANRLRQAIPHGTRQIDKRTPGGRFDGRAYASGRAEHAAGRPNRGNYIYVTEDIIPAVKAGQTVAIGQPIGTFSSGLTGRSGCIEIGCAAGPSPTPIALQDGGYRDGTGCNAWRTVAGNNTSDLLRVLGGPYGLRRDQPIHGHFP